MPASDPSIDEGEGELPSSEVSADDFSVRAPALTLPKPDRFGSWKGRLRRAASIASVVIALGGSVVGGTFAHRWITHTPRFGARDIEVTGLSHSTRDQVLAAAHLAPGVNVLGFDTRRAERGIAELPWVAHVHVTRRLPGSVRIEIAERAAAAIVSAGGLYLTAADGTLFKRAGTGDPDDLPVITGVARDDFARDPDAARENVRDALALLADFESSSLASRVHVDEVHRDATGDLSMVLAESGTYVWLGRGPYRAKMSRLSVILGELTNQHIRAAEIHLESDRHPERATVRVPVAPEAFAQLPCAAPAPPAPPVTPRAAPVVANANGVASASAIVTIARPVMHERRGSEEAPSFSRAHRRHHLR
jgi:cell division protein FtsQ